MHSNGQAVPERIFLEYLDGRLSAAQRAVVEDELARNGALQEQARLHRMIERTLIERFTPPPCPGLPREAVPQIVARRTPAGRAACAAGTLATTATPVGGTMPGSDAAAPSAQASAAASTHGGTADGGQPPHPLRLTQPERGWRRWAMIAALLVLSAGGFWSAYAGMRSYFWRPREIPLSLGPSRPLDEVFREQVASGFRPDWVCETDEDFSGSFAYKYGQRLALRSLPEDVRLVGMAYRTALTRGSTLVLGRAGDEPVMLVVDLATRDRDDAAALAARGGCGSRSEAGAESPLHVHRRVVGNLVVYEASALPAAVFLPNLYDPDRGQSQSDRP